MQITAFQLGGLNLYTNPLIHDYNDLAMQQDGQIIRLVNVDSFPYGAKIKRPGYTTYLGTPDNGTVLSLFSWTQDNGTSLFTYRASGSLLYYSTQGTGAWTVAGNGTITPGSQVGYAILNNTLIISQNAGTTRHTTSGTSFTDTSLAPAGGQLIQYQNRIYLGGTSSILTYSVTGDPTNWNISGTSDSSSLTIPGPGKINKLFKTNNRLFIDKTYRQLYKWDGFYLIDLVTNLGPSSPFSVGTTEDTSFWINDMGVYSTSGDQPQLLSNPIQRYFYNTNGSAIAGTSFSQAPGACYRYDYLVAVGSMTDDFTNETVNSAVIKYDFQKNEFMNYSFNDFPTAMHSYIDASGNRQMIFGNAGGQAFQFGGTALNDNGQPIESIIEMVFNFNVPHLQKDWRNFWAFFNPGCQAQIEFAWSDVFIKEEKEWQVIGDAREGAIFYRFPNEIRSRFLYVKIIESSRNSRFNFYGIALDADIVPVP